MSPAHSSSPITCSCSSKGSLTSVWAVGMLKAFSFSCAFQFQVSGVGPVTLTAAASHFVASPAGLWWLRKKCSVGEDSIAAVILFMWAWELTKWCSQMEQYLQYPAVPVPVLCWILRHLQAQTWFMLGVYTANSKMSVACGLWCQGILEWAWAEVSAEHREAQNCWEGSQHLWPRVLWWFDS